MRLQSLIILCVVLVLACSKDPETTCDLTPCTVDLPLSKQALDYIANYEGVESVVFENSQGNEVFFDIGYDTLYQGQCRTIAISDREYCEEDRKYYSEVTGTTEECKVILRSADVDYRIVIWLRHQYTIYDCELSVENLNVDVKSESQDLAFNIGLEHYLVGYGVPASFLYSKVLESLILNGSEFKNVIVDNFNNSEPEFKFFYNLEYGLVGFTDNRNGETFSYVRVE